MGEKIELGKVQVFVGDKPVAIDKMVNPLNIGEGFGKFPNDRKVEKELGFQHSFSFDVQMTEELRKLQEELADGFNRQYEDWLKRVNVAVRKILTEYIDDPFTTDPEKATKEEFEKRHLNALVYQEMADGSQSFVGVLQGSTIVCVTGMKIETFDGLK